MSTARVLQNDLQQATGLNAFDQELEKELMRVGLRERRSSL